MNGTPLRDIIQTIKDLGYSTAKFAPESNSNNIQKILEGEVRRYMIKFLVCLALEIPILFFLWIMPYAFSDFLTKYPTFNGMPAYIIILFVLSTIIQFGAGIGFYKGAYKSIRACSANMDVLVVLGTTAAWGYGVILLFINDHIYAASEQVVMKGMDTGGHSGMTGMDKGGDSTDAVSMQTRMAIQEHAHNFEIASTLITVILLGKFLESISKKQTVDKLSQLASLKVSKAILMD
jgi:Cu+-exporting ATPase